MKQTKSVTKWLVMILLVTACQTKNKVDVSETPVAPQTPAPVPAPVQASEEGGITSGGGGTLPANPISINDVYHVVDSSRQILRLYINFERQYGVRDSTGESRFFFGPRNLATVLEETDLEILNDKPCKDKNGNDVDASIHASRPGSICLSAFRVAPKLIKEVMHTEINALILHELAHLLGATEAEAVSLQTSMVFHTDDTSYKDLSLKLFFLATNMEPIGTEVRSLVMASKTETPEKLNESVNELLTKAMDWSDPLDFPFSIHDGQQGEYYDLQLARIRSVTFYVATLIEDAGQQYAIERYNDIFAGAQEVTLEQFGDRTTFGTYKDNMFKAEKVKRLNSRDDLESFMKDLSEYFSEQRMLAAAIGYDQPMPTLSGPWNANEPQPFMSFLGKYEVLSMQCSGDWDMGTQYGLDFKELEFFQEPKDNNQVYVKRSAASWSGADGYYRNYASQVIRISGDANQASRVEERGNRWFSVSNNHGYRKTTHQITNSGGSYAFKIRYDDYRIDFKKGVETNYYECNYTLKKTN